MPSSWEESPTTQSGAGQRLTAERKRRERLGRDCMRRSGDRVRAVVAGESGFVAVPVFDGAGALLLRTERDRSLRALEVAERACTRGWRSGPQRLVQSVAKRRVGGVFFSCMAAG